jgi:hypothetical protein
MYGVEPENDVLELFLQLINEGELWNH